MRGNPTGGAERIIPAYAGSTGSWSAARRRTSDHPRIRGEHAVFPVDLLTCAGSSPHTRGALIIFRSIAAFQGIIPAYAGSTGWVRHTPHIDRDHPRIRGEHKLTATVEQLRGGSSPHTRGAPEGPFDPWDRLRIIPAYAGSTAFCAT